MTQRILFFFGAICLSVASAFGLSYGHCQISGSESASCGASSFAVARLNPEDVTVGTMRPVALQGYEASAPLRVPSAPLTASVAAASFEAPAERSAPLSTDPSAASMLTEPTAQRGMSVLYSDAPLATAAQPRLSTTSPELNSYDETAYLGVTKVEAVPNYLIGVYR